MSEIDRVKSLISGLQRQYPKIYEALSALAKSVDILDTSIEEVKSQIRSIPETGLAIAPNVTVFTYELTKYHVILRWEQPDTSIFAYEIKQGGTGWSDASTVLKSSTLSAVFDPIPVGVTTYWIKGIDFDGNESVAALRLDVTVPAIGSINITATVIDNNVLFSWSEPASVFDIDYYLIYRDTTLIGKQKGTFAVSFESVGGTFTYKIKAVDIAGNVGPESSITAEVRQPPDFDLLGTLDDEFLDGVRVDVYRDAAAMKLVANVDMCGV